MNGAIPKATLRRSLIGKFGFEPYQGGKHEAVTLRLNGKKVATTRFSRGCNSDDLGPSLLKQIARQLRLNNLAKLRGMVECSVSREAYVGILKAGGYLD